MRQKHLFLGAVEARVADVIAAGGTVRVALTAHHPPSDSEIVYGESVVPLGVFPPELLRPGADVWLICRRSLAEWVDVIDACPRTGRELPAEYRQAFAESAKAEAEYIAQSESADERRQAQLRRYDLWESMRHGRKVGHDIPAVWPPHNRPMRRTGPAV